MSKYFIPLVVFIQYWAQLRYPSKRNLKLRRALLALYGFGAVFMAFQSACTDVIRANWPRPHDTLRWARSAGVRSASRYVEYTPAAPSRVARGASAQGGYDSAEAPILVIAALTAGNFVVCVPKEDVRILLALVLPSGEPAPARSSFRAARAGPRERPPPARFVCVITLLWSTEGTLALGSKWCTYCLIYSFIFLAAPFWDGTLRGGREAAPEVAKGADTPLEGPDSAC